VFNSAIPDNTILALAFDRKGNLMIGTANGGAAIFNDAGLVSGVSSGDNETAASGALVRPNPVTGTGVFGFTLAAPARVTIAIFDALGARVATLGGTMMDAGERSLAWDASGMPAGAYFYRLQTGTAATTGRIVVAR
jgi:hypothetical protein